MKNLPKKIISLFMVFAMSAAVPSAVSAEDATINGVGEADASANVTINSTPNYIVTIPQDVVLKPNKDIQSYDCSVQLIEEDAVPTNHFLKIEVKFNGGTSGFNLYSPDKSDSVFCNYAVERNNTAMNQKTININANELKTSSSDGSGFARVPYYFNLKLDKVPKKVGIYTAENDEPVKVDFSFSIT